MIKLHHHYSLTLNWVKAKAKTTNWLSWEEKYGYVHLYRVLYKFIYIHWFSYTFKNDLLEILESFRFQYVAFWELYLGAVELS